MCPSPSGETIIWESNVSVTKMLRGNSRIGCDNNKIVA